MFTLPYQTTICGIYKNFDKVFNATSRAALDLPFPPVRTPAKYEIRNTGFVTPREEHESVPNFTQLLNIGTPDKPKLLVDSRQYMSYDQRSGDYKLVASNDWQFQCVRLALNLRLLEGDETFFSRLSDLPAKVFIRWVPGELIRRYNLGIESQMAMYVIAGYYYYAMCNDELRKPGDMRVQMAPVVARVTGVPVETVLAVCDQLGKLENANDLAHELSTNANTIRMGNLKFTDLYLLLSNSWFGVNARENVGVALEHLPTYITMLYMALAERSYRKTVITQRAESITRGNDLKAFTDLVHRAVTDYYSN
jgi:hypothetical protein